MARICVARMHKKHFSSTGNGAREKMLSFLVCRNVRMCVLIKNVSQE